MAKIDIKTVDDQLIDAVYEAMMTSPNIQFSGLERKSLEPLKHTRPLQTVTVEHDFDDNATIEVNIKFHFNRSL